MLREAVAKRAKGDTEELCCGLSHAARAFDRLEDEAALDLAEHLLQAAPFGRQIGERGRRASAQAADGRRQIAEADCRTRRERDASLDHIFELAHIAGK